MITLDDWQKEVLKTKGDLVLCSGRQVGKSTIVAIKAGEEVANNRNFSLMIISATDRQACELYNKCLNYITEMYPRLIKRGKDRPTKHELKLVNGSIIRSLPVGLAGQGIRGYTVNGLIADECAFIQEDVFTAVEPMLMTTNGWMWLLSTPHGKQGYFYKRYMDPNCKVFHVNSEQVIRDRPLSGTWTQEQRDGALNHIEKKKKTMSQLEFAQEYMGEFIDKLRQWFSDETIKKCMTRRRLETISKNNNYFLGVDVARMGEDDSSFEIVDKMSKESIHHIENIVTSRTRITDTVLKILDLDKAYNFK